MLAQLRMEKGLEVVNIGLVHSDGLYHRGDENGKKTKIPRKVFHKFVWLLEGVKLGHLGESLASF